MSQTTAKSSGRSLVLACGLFMLIGLIFGGLGYYFVSSVKGFTEASSPAQLRVLDVERKQSDDGYVYRPTFEARSQSGQTLEYTSAVWVSPKPHSQGDVVDGRVIWDTGEIRSNTMMKQGRFMGAIFTTIGGIAFVVGFLVLVGGPVWRGIRGRPAKVH